MPAPVVLTLLIGETPAPVPADVAQAVQDVEVSLSDGGRSGFQVTLQAPKDTTTTSGYGFVGDPLFQVFNRIIIEISVFGQTAILIDGIITHQQLRPGWDPDGSLFTITGEDLSVLMDLEERVQQYPNQDEESIVNTILARYSQYGITPDVKAQPLRYTPDKNEYVEVQSGTDLRFLRELASRFGYVFFVRTGRQRRNNTAYWGPPVLDKTPQRAISIDLGSETNTAPGAWFEYNALTPTKVFGSVQDRITDVVAALKVESPELIQGLSGKPALQSQKKVRNSIVQNSEGRTTAGATAWAQGSVDQSVSNVMQVRGKLNTMLYGGVLQRGATVDLRGGSSSYDGRYYVRKVVHILSRQDYWQEFVLTRDGLKTTEQKVNV